jgi:hypothetical protein
VERVLVSPSGVHVVTSLPVGSAPTASVDAGAVSTAKAAADVVTALLPQRYRGRVRPVLSRLDEVAMAEIVDDVLITAPSTLEHIVACSPVVLSTSEVNDVALRLDARLEPFPIAHAQTRRRWRRRHSLLLALGAAASSAAVVVLTQGVGGVPLPW